MELGEKCGCEEKLYVEQLTMGKTIELTCEQCGVAYSKSLAEHKRCESRGYRRFCSRNCGKIFMKQNGKEFVQHLQEWANGDSNKKHLANLRTLRTQNAEPFKEFLRRARKSVKSKGRELDITIEQLKELWTAQDGICPYTGWKMELPKSTEKKKPNTASLDRIDSSKGYILGNIQIVCVMANFAKSDFSNEEMQEFCKAIASK